MSSDLVRRYWPGLCRPRHYGPSVTVTRSPICRYNPPTPDMSLPVHGKSTARITVNSISRLCAPTGRTSGEARRVASGEASGAAIGARRPVRASQASAPSGGQRRIFVAFDAGGRHYAYAVHWDTMPPQFQREQHHEVMTMIRANREAYGENGVVRLLGGEAFSRLIQVSRQASF